MKTQLTRTRWLVFVAFLLTGLHEANAWYSPSQQRWINRDPIDEGGSKVLRRVEPTLKYVDGKPLQSPNAYVFCNHQMPNNIDPYGLDAYQDCLAECKQALHERYRDVDACATFLGKAGAGVGAGVGLIMGGQKGRGITGALLGSLVGVIDYVGVQLIGTIYSDVVYLGCVKQCQYAHRPPHPWGGEERQL